MMTEEELTALPPIDWAHVVWQDHVPEDGSKWCRVCGERWRCSFRQVAADILIREGHLVLPPDVTAPVGGGR